MKYEYSLIHCSNRIGSDVELYSITLVEARELIFFLNGSEVILSGRYLFCFSGADTVKDIAGDYTAKALFFLPYFYNINLNTAIIDAPIYDEMREKYGYPDFSLFLNRNGSYKGIIKLTDSEYDNIYSLLSSAKGHIEDSATDRMWSCRTRSDMIGILRIAEAAHTGKHTDLTNEVLRYIRSNLRSDLSLPALCQRFNMNRTTLADTVKKLTGLTPGRYVLSERLGQSRPDLLFTWLSVEEISAKYGFTDVNYYIRAFRKNYGVTPLQYRRTGYEKRVREEKNYRLKNGGKGLMTAGEFGEYLRNGLGIAVIRLRREPDRSRFRDVFRDHIRNGRHPSFSDFSYEDELLSCFEDADGLRNGIISELLSSGDLSDPYHIGLLVHWGAVERLPERKEMPGTVCENRNHRPADVLSGKMPCEEPDKPGIPDGKYGTETDGEFSELRELCRPSVTENLSADYFLDHDPAPSPFLCSRLFTSGYLPFRVIRQVNRAVMECDDPEKRKNLIALFHCGDRRVRPVFSTLPLLSELKDMIGRDPEASECYELASFVLCFRHQRIREYAAELIRDNRLLPIAVQSRFFYNYEKEDRELFARKLSEPYTGCGEGLLYRRCFTNGIREGLCGLPLEMVHRVFREWETVSLRRDFIRAMYIGGVTDPNVTEEALYDKDPVIRQYGAWMRDKVPYIGTKRLNPTTAGDCVRFLDRNDGSVFGTGLDRHMKGEEWEASVLSPVKEDLFYDASLLSLSARVRLITEKRIDGFLAYRGKKPVGFLDCGKRERFVYLNQLAGEGETDEFVMTEPVTYGDMHIAQVLVRRAVSYAIEDRCRTVRAYLQKSRCFPSGDTYHDIMAVYRDAGFEILEEDENNAVLALRNEKQIGEGEYP